MSWIYRNAHGGALSLAAMVNLSLGAERSFLKDKEMTCSNWGSPHLSIRQLIYAALDAQTSFVAGANQMQIPKPFHVSDMPRAWLSKAAQWKQRLRSHKMHIDSKGAQRPTAASQAEQTLLDATSRYFAQFMQGEEPFQPFVAALTQVPFPTSLQAAMQSMPPPNAHLLEPPAPHEPPLSPSFFHSEDLVIETANVHWWLHPKMEAHTNAAFNQHAYWQLLHESQQRALQMAEHTRVQIITGRQFAFFLFCTRLLFAAGSG